MSRETYFFDKALTQCVKCENKKETSKSCLFLYCSGPIMLW